MDCGSQSHDRSSPAPPASSARSRRILGVDPGLHATGYAVIDVGGRRPLIVEAGVIRSSEPHTKPELATRIRSVYDSIVEVIEQLYAHYAHPRTAILMAHVRGVIFLAAAQHHLIVHSYNATRIKKTITGSGRAPKDQIQRTVQRELRLAELPEPPDVADALAAALCHHYLQVLPGAKGS